MNWQDKIITLETRTNLYLSDYQDKVIFLKFELKKFVYGAQMFYFCKLIMKKPQLSILYLAFRLMLFMAAVSACGSHGNQPQKLDEASSLMATRPDSSLRILRSIETEACHFDKAGHYG